MIYEPWDTILQIEICVGLACIWIVLISFICTWMLYHDGEVVFEVSVMATFVILLLIATTFILGSMFGGIIL